MGEIRKMEYEVIRLVKEILGDNLKHLRHDCPEDITDRVFLEIENNPELFQRYRQLISSRTQHSINAAIGKHVIITWNLDNIGRCYKPRSKLIKSYEKH